GEAMAVIAQGFVELLLARNPLRVVELAANPAGAVDQGHRVAALAQRGGAGHAGRAGTHHGDALAPRRRLDLQLGLVAGARVDQAARALVDEDMVETGLVAGDAGVDAFAAAGLGLVRPRGI